MAIFITMKTYYFNEENIASTDQLSDLLDSWVIEGKNTYRNLTEEDRSFKPSPEVWSPREIIGHLIDSARYNLMRFSEIPLETSPYMLKVYDPDNLVLLFDYQNQNDKNLITFWEQLNLQISGLIRNVKTADLERLVIIQGEVFSLAYIMYDYVGHLGHHLAELKG
ncbi:MAG: DinB family protein [Saprospiraceae bacterium]|nr:DinB family protein [Saprospiraceae bacterium]MBL0083223.1 DinB family protein [Saprospiraceae bacterium]